MVTTMNVLQHSVQGCLRNQNNPLCTIFPARQGVLKSESSLFGLLLVFFQIKWLLFWQVNLWEKWPYHGLIMPFIWSLFNKPVAFIIWNVLFWWHGQCIVATYESVCSASNSDRISEAYDMSLLFEVKNLFYFQIAPWACITESA